MRFKIYLRQKKEGQLIPYNYQYYISSFIYDTISRADRHFAGWLHDEAYTNGNKKFKLFTFSKLNIPRFEQEGNHLKIASSDVYLTLTMLIDKIAEKVVAGLFEEQKLTIFNGDVRADFHIKFIEQIPEPAFTETMYLRTISPVLLKKKETTGGNEKVIFLRPDDEDYLQYLRTNLEAKYKVSSQQADSVAINNGTIESFKVLNGYKASLIKIKEGKPDEVMLKAYNYHFEIKGSPELIRIGYQSGFGINNSLGFGCVEVL